MEPARTDVPVSIGESGGGGGDGGGGGGSSPPGAQCPDSRGLGAGGCHEMVSLAGPPVDVGVTMYVLSISSLSEVQMVRVSHSRTKCRCHSIHVEIPTPAPRWRARTARGQGGQAKGTSLIWFSCLFRRRNTQDKFACGYRPACGRRSHHVRAEYQLRLRGVDGTYSSILLDHFSTSRCT